MKLSTLIIELDRLDRLGIYAFTAATMRRIFCEDDRTMTKALKAHAATGVIQRVARGLYVNPRARSLPADRLAAMVPWLRPPPDFSWLSLESALSEAGLISQLPSRLTLMTTGRSGVFDTPFGIIEFTHTNQDRPDTVWDDLRELNVATAPQAKSDLMRTKRNLGLVIEEVDDIET
ncbi:MAG TPA: hypothetical protein HPP80_05095 [Rhodospirillaceae bacterium]|nr:hypothetical protein [Rhodospirillaceae bacterium]